MPSRSESSWWPAGSLRLVSLIPNLKTFKALDVPTGMLIYCQRDGDASHTAIIVGAHHTRLDTWALTLAGSPADTERRLRDLADQIIERAAA